jgi:L-ascorbate metabolism protein UlaG (beta-lactamase superfamily)
MIVFLDAYVDRAPTAPPVGVAIADIGQADWIVIGHSHFDHLWGAERIARRTGATIIGSHETVRIMEAQGVPRGQLMAVQGGDRVRLAGDVTVSVYPGLHSCSWSHFALPGATEVCLGDLGQTYQERMGGLARLRKWMDTLNGDVTEHLTLSHQGARGDGSVLIFVFQTPAGSLLFQDTSGYWTGIMRDLRPDVAILAAAGRGNVDGEPTQGTLAQFVASETDLIRPRRLVLSHHDDWMPGFSNPIDPAVIRQAINGSATTTELVEMDYLRPHPVFDGLPLRRPVPF